MCTYEWANQYLMEGYTCICYKNNSYSYCPQSVIAFHGVGSIYLYFVFVSHVYVVKEVASF